jgi:hypothetical protein
LALDLRRGRRRTETFHKRWMDGGIR